jgi:NAD(P)-dependent dehydrogenase (short-subunit alcohol dehydrogenase family)
MGDSPVAVITGAASGIGAATAQALAVEGYGLLLGDVAEEALHETAAGLEAHEVPVVAAPLDVCDRESVRAFVAAGVERFGAFSCVFANAGISLPERPLGETSDSDLDRVIAVNLRGTILVVREALPHLRKGSSVILTSSTAGQQAHPGTAIYSATKFALIGFGRSLALELAPARIRVNMVCPGGVDTPLVREIYGEETPRVLAEYAQTNPLGRFAVASDVADAVVFLASDKAQHINGVALRVDGGDCLLGAL